MHTVLRIFNILKTRGRTGLITAITRRVEILRRLAQYQRVRAGQRHYPTAERLAEMARVQFRDPPLISVLLPVYNPPDSYLQSAIQSVFEQVYPHWQLCLVDDCSTDPAVRPYLEQLSASDPRVRVLFRQENGHIAAATNSALSIADGDYIALLDQDDELAPHALFCVAQILAENPALDWVYSNEEKIDSSGRSRECIYKPAFSYEYLTAFMYTGHLSVYRRTLVEQLGGFRQGFEGAQDYDIALRMAEKTTHVHHIPDVLYYWREHTLSVAANRDAKPYAYENGRRALQEHFARLAVPLGIREHPTARGVYMLTSGQDTVEALYRSCGFVSMQHSAHHAGGIAASISQSIMRNLEREPLEIQGAGVAEGGQALTDMLATANSFFDEGCTRVICIDTRLRFETSSDLEQLLLPLLLPGVAACVPRMVKGHRILLGGLCRDGDTVTHLFHGSSRHAAGYGARLIALHTSSMVSPFAFSITRAALHAACESLSSASDPYVAAAKLSLLLQQSGMHIAMNPNATTCWSGGRFPRSVSLRVENERRQGSDSLEPRLGSFFDPYYPTGLDRQYKNFQVSL